MDILGVAGIALTSLTIILTIYHFNRGHGKLRLQLNIGRAVNSDDYGTYLAALVTISNSGRTSIYFGGFQAIDQKGEIYYPSISIEPQTRIEPGQYIQGAIPAGHLLNTGIKKLWAIDGNGNKYSINRFSLRKLIFQLSIEAQRLKSLEFE